MPLTFTKKAAGAATSDETQKPASALSEHAPLTSLARPARSPSSREGLPPRPLSLRRKPKPRRAVAEWNRPRRYKIGFNEDGQITFLDGKLDEDGMLDIPRYTSTDPGWLRLEATRLHRRQSISPSLARSARPATSPRLWVCSPSSTIPHTR